MTTSSKTPFTSNRINDAGFNPRAVAALFREAIYDMYDEWNAERPLRTGFPHASNILSPESDFCLRKLVLLAAYPDDAVRSDDKPWDRLSNARFKHGWKIHEKYQELLKRYYKVLYFRGEAELDLTHFSEEHQVFYSPDAIVEHCGVPMIVEIKGYKTETVAKLSEIGPAPKDALIQGNFYAHLMGYEHVLILVEDKNTQRPLVWYAGYDEALTVKPLARTAAFKEAHNIVQAGGNPPERKCKSITDRQALKCEVRELCFRNR